MLSFSICRTADAELMAEQLRAEGEGAKCNGGGVSERKEARLLN